MRRLLILTSAFLVAAGMAVAQDSSQSTMSSSQQPTVDSNNLRGCLTAGGDQFKLTTDVGAKVVNLNVDKKTATPYVAHEVEVQGMTGSDGNFRVDRILDLADHCGHTGQATAAESGAKAATDANAGQQTNLGAATASPENTQAAVPAGNQSSAVASPSSTTATPDTSASASTAAPSGSQSMASSQTNPSTSTTTTSPDTTAAANPPASTTPAPDASAQPSTSSTSTTASTSSTDMNAQNAQASSSSQPSAVATPPATQPAPDSNAVATEQKPSTSADQSATSSTTTQSSTTTTDQSAAAAPADQNSGKSQLPQTGSPLPLLGLLGVGSFAAGLISRKRK